MLQHIVWGWLLCLGLLLTCGCQRVWVDDPANRMGLAEQIQPIHASLETTDWFPLKPSSGRFLVVEGDDDGQFFTWRLQPAQTGWLYSYEGLQQVWLERDEQGSLGIGREDDLEEEVSVTYDPALIMLPQRLESGQTLTQAVRMEVRSLDGQEVRSRGNCINTITFLGRQHICTPAGDFTAMMVRSVRQIHLPIARVEVVILSAFVPDKGQVAERLTQKIRALHLFDLEETREIRLAK